MNSLSICSILQQPFSSCTCSSHANNGAQVLQFFIRNVKRPIFKSQVVNKEVEDEKPGNILAMSAAIAYMSYAQSAQAAVADDPLCIGFAGDKTYTVVIIACILQAVALVGAAVGGILARQRKLEVEKINVQLRQIFAKMRRQYQVETYAPSLTYAPATFGRVQEAQSTVVPEKQALMKHLRAGKKYLREKNPQAAFDEFQRSLSLAKKLNDRVEQKKAARGLGASCQRQGNFKEAIKYHTMVLTTAHLSGEHSGYTEALGAIADCYTELGDFENAAKFYDQYIARLDNEED